MAIPAAPSNFYAQTGNQQNFLSWDLAAGALSYSVQQSLDGVTYSVVGTPATNSYLDTAVTVGVQYFYKVASVNVSGTSAYTAPQAVVPTPSGEMSLGQIRLAAQQRADRVNSQFVTLPEWNSYINQSLFELYDLLITTYEDYYLAPALQFTTVSGQSFYPLPNGTNYSGALPFYKLRGVDLGLNATNQAYVTLNKFNFMDRNKYIYPNSGSTIYGVLNLQYRVMGSNIELIPFPSNAQPMQLWYIPRLQQLLKDTDITTSSVSGWIEYVIVDAAIKALQKEESDISVLAVQKMALIKRIEETASNRDAGMPDTISDVRSQGGWGSSSGGWNGPMGGY
jgi:hypothetical protein